MGCCATQEDAEYALVHIRPAFLSDTVSNDTILASYEAACMHF